MALNDYEYSYRSLVFGGTTVYEVECEKGIFDIDVRQGDRPFARWHGQIPGLHYADGKYIEFDLVVTGTIGSTTLATRIQNVLSKFNPYDYPEPSGESADLLVFKYPGFDERFIRCRPTKVRIIRVPETELGAKPIAVQLFAYDPRTYKNTETDSGATSGTFVVANDGNINAYPWVVFTLNGSGAAKLTNSTNSTVLEISGGSAGATTNCRMDRLSYGSRSLIIYTGSTDKYHLWVAPRSGLYLSPGNNTLVLNSGTNVQVKFYPPFA